MVSSGFPVETHWVLTFARSTAQLSVSHVTFADFLILGIVAVDIRTHDLEDLRRCAIAIGSEGRGLTEQVLAMCDKTVRIPMQAHCESLNAAMAAAVLLWEAYR